MKSSMITQDADTFVALGQAVSLAAVEGALDEQGTRDLTAALVAGILSGCMELDTYTRVHDALANLLERAFQGPPRSGTAGGSSNGGGGAAGDDSLGVYLEVVGEAWEKVAWGEEVCGRLTSFVEGAFDLSRGRFGGGAWFRAPLLGSVEQFARDARAAGLLVVSVQGALPEGEFEAVLETAEAPPGPSRILLGWGERRTALDLKPASSG